MGLLNHQALQIVKGIGIVPGDTSSPEQNPDVIDLLSANSAFSLVNWSPNIPSLKQGGIWADSSLSDGRQLVNGVNTNVIETITVQLTGASCQAFAANFAALQRIIQSARKHWDTFYQIEPLYLLWKASGAPGPQYALIYNIDMKITYQDSVTFQAEIILSIEREVGWRGVKPGGTPQEWAFYANGIYTQFNQTNINLRSGSTHTATGTVNNRQEFNTIHTFSRQNFLDIPASKLPGDLPPLLCLVTQPQFAGSGQFMNVLVSRVSKPVTLPDRKGNTLPRYNAFVGAAGSLGTNAAFVNDGTNGIIHNPVSANQRRVDVTFATATDQTRLTWAASSTFTHTNPNLLRGRYRILIRSNQTGGVLGNVTMYLKFISASGTFFTTPTISPLITAGGAPFVQDLGVVTIPPDNNVLQMSKGSGQLIAPVYGVAGDLDGNITIELHAARTGGAGTLEFFDFILMPFDEGSILIAPQVAGSGAAEAVIYDNTGYYGHGSIDVIGTSRLEDGSSGLDTAAPTEIKGGMELEPGVNNRLYFLWWTLSPFNSRPTDTMACFIDIVPRWSGIRDV